MARIRLEKDDIELMSKFQFITRVTPLDSYTWNDKVVFMVPYPKIGQAIGKQGANIKKIEQITKKNIKIAGLSKNIDKVIKSLLFPLEITEITTDEIEENNKKIYKLVTIQGKDKRTNGQIIGHDSKNLKEFTKILKKYFDIKNIKVI